MAVNRNPRVYIEADASSVKKATRDTEKEIGRLGRTGSAAFTGLKVGALAAGAAIGGVFVASLRTGISEMIEAEKAGAQTAAAIRSTGGAAGVTRKHIEGMASSLQLLTGMEDDAIQQAANLGLAFTNVQNRGDGVNAVYDRMLRATVDIAARTGKDLDPVMRGLGRSLNDPIRGMGALSRLGIDFDKQTRERIKTLAEEGKTLQAQKLILEEVERRYRGAGEAAGETLQGKLNRLNRAWEDISQTLAVAMLPVLERVSVGLLRNKSTVERVAEGVASAIDGMVQFAGAIFKGDWERAWDLAEKGAGQALRAIGELAKHVLLPLAQDAGNAIAQGLINGLDEGLKNIRGGNSIRRLLGLAPGQSAGDILTIGVRVRMENQLTPAIDRLLRVSDSLTVRTRAGGGFIPGTYRGVDDQVALLASGEAVLTPAQQAMVPGGRATLNRIFRATGGVVGGDRFAQGGVVTAAAQRASSNLGEPYGKPSRGESRTGPNSWDCSGYATMVAGVNVGGTTASAYSSSIGVRDHSRFPIVWGFRKSHSGGYRGGYDEHMGVRVGGVWYQTSGGRTARTGSDGDWQEIRVPRGLENIRDADAGGPRDASVGGATGGGAARVGANGGLTVSGFRAGLRADAAERRAGAGGDMTAIGSITGRHADDQLQERRMQAAGAPESRVLQARRNELVQDIRDIDGRLGELAARLRTYVQRRVKLRREALNPRTRPARRARIRELIGDLIDLETQIQDAQRTLRSERTDLVRQAMILGYDIADAVAQEEQAARDAATGTGAGAAEPVVTNELTAQQRGLINTGILAEEFIRTAFGPGDIGTGGGTAMAAATGGRYVTVNVDAASFAAATATAAGTQGYITVAAVPSGA